MNNHPECCAWAWDEFEPSAAKAKASTAINSVPTFYTDVCFSFKALMRNRFFLLSQKFLTLN